MKWLNFLHLYQPVNTDAHIIKEATEQSYLRIVRALEEHPHIKFTCNINGSLFLRWKEMGYQDLIRRFAKLVHAGRIDLTGTAAYHPIIPLIPEEEAIRQIKENEKILRENIGDYKPRGFFFPEMAYSPEAARLVRELGYEWVILDEIASGKKEGEADLCRVYLDKNSGLKAVLRSREDSNSYVPEVVRDIIKKNSQAEDDSEKVSCLVTATDAELYGLRYIDHTAEFEKLLGRKDYETMTFSKFIEEGGDPIEIAPPPHTWATEEKELKKGEPFNLWQEKTNAVQKKLWALANMAYDVIQNKFPDDPNHQWARWHLVRGLASCTFWWASAKDFRLFGPLSWSPDEIERGTNEFIRGIRAIDDEESRDSKIEAEKLYIQIKKMIWQKHWAYYWKK